MDTRLQGAKIGTQSVHVVATKRSAATKTSIAMLVVILKNAYGHRHFCRFMCTGSFDKRIIGMSCTEK